MSRAPQKGTGDAPGRGHGSAGEPRLRPVFLERSTYRQRRLIDAIRLMPVLGAILWAVPLLWTRGVTFSSAALLYLFAIWIVLVFGAALLSRAIRGVSWTGSDANDRGDGG